MFLKLTATAGLVAMAAFAVPAAAQQIVHHERETVTTHTEVHPDDAVVHQGMHKVCKNIWRHHRHIHSCRTVRWTR